MTPPPARRPRRRLDVEARRTAILEAATEVFAQAPYPQVQMARIAEAAGASTALVFHYFGNKAGLYLAVAQAAVADLEERSQAAQAALPAGSARRDRVRTALLVYLDHVAERPQAWAAPYTVGGEPSSVLELRRQARERSATALAGLLGVDGHWQRHAYAVAGHFGFVDAAVLRWVQRGCPTDERDHVVEACLGALQGAAGDWGG